MVDKSRVPARKSRVDAERNRQRLLEAAKQAFAQSGPSVSLEEIARTAGVGIGTFYRNFPTREALVEEVYRSESLQLAKAAERLADEHPPIEALRAWLLLFIDFLATKRVMAEAIGSMVGSSVEMYETSGALVKAAITALVQRAKQAGDTPGDIEPLDLLRALIGVANASGGERRDASAKQLVDILISGLQAHPVRSQ